MTQAIPSHRVVLPPEVLAFAAEQGVTAYLPTVVAMTQRLFPEAPLNVLLESDPEIANDWHLVLRVEAKDLEVPRALEARYQWHRELFTCCPAALVCVFRLGLELSR